MQTIRVAIALALVALVIYIVATGYAQFAKSSGTVWERLLAAGRDSATILWGKFCLVLAGIIGNLDSTADVLNLPEMKTFINSWVGDPKLIAGIMAAIAFVSILARKRTL